ncbi:MAG: response regulator transcription factor [Campylobacterota bacterium]|nr:response regulator transcription factor [Campylobacterota bacterium]
MKILLLEDELMLLQSVEEYIVELGYEINSFSDGIEAQNELKENRYDLLILDINVPNFNGLELLDDLNKSQNFTPAIFISADTSIESISDAFDLGAIDYLKKPFHLKELGIRIQKEIQQLKKDTILHINFSKNYTYSKEDHALYYNKELQKLTNKRLKIVEYLALNTGRIITIDTLREYIWDNDPVSDATIRAEVSRLKKSLKEDFITNIKGIGYTINTYTPSV